MLLKQLQRAAMMPDQNPVKTKSFNDLLQEMINNAEQNCCKFPTHRRHSVIIKKFAAALFLYAGPLAYEFFQQNMPEALPCTRTIQSAIHSEYESIDKGSFRFDELKAHIERYEAPHLFLYLKMPLELQDEWNMTVPLTDE